MSLSPLYTNSGDCIAAVIQAVQMGLLQKLLGIIVLAEDVLGRNERCTDPSASPPRMEASTRIVDVNEYSNIRKACLELSSEIEL